MILLKMSDLWENMPKCPLNGCKDGYGDTVKAPPPTLSEG
jgi:hypothetical protein